MATNNEELMRSFIRAGRTMQHLDCADPHCAHGPHGPHGPHGHGHGPAPEALEAEGASEIAQDAAAGELKDACGHGHGPHDQHGPHGPHGPHGHNHGGGPGHGGPHGRGNGRHGQARALSLIAMQEGITQKDLAYLLGIRPQSVGEMLAKLEGFGLIERRKSETDARAIQLYLTEDGRTHAEEIDRIRKVVAADVFSVLSEEEKDQLATIIGKVQAELDKYRPQHHKAPAGNGRKAAEGGAEGSAEEPAEEPAE